MNGAGGFAALTEDERKEISAKGGRAAHNRHVFTREEAQTAARLRKNLPAGDPLPMRKKNGRYEYQVNHDGELKWVSRQAVFLLRQKGKI